MPELPEVEVLRRSLEPQVVGRRIERVEVHSPALREPLDRAALEGLAGHRVTAARRRSKYLLLDTERLEIPVGSASRDELESPTGPTLGIHLGMSGRATLRPSDEPEALHEHLALHLDDGRRLRLVDPRRFGQAFVLPRAEVATDRRFAHLGPEPLEPVFDGATLARAARGRRGPMKTFLMDARVVVGVGNIYASEALWRARVHPRRSVARVASATWNRIAVAVQDVLRQAIEEGGTTLNDFADGDGKAGYFQVSLEAYGRDGAPCRRCGTALRRLVLSNRSTFYCPRCQR